MTTQEETSKSAKVLYRPVGMASNEGTLGNWCAKARSDGVGDGTGVLSESERAELVRLRKEIVELRMQRDVSPQVVVLL
ncbi:MAG: hypothetical protein ACOH2F_14795 [Cellulomonas sp.]